MAWCREGKRTEGMGDSGVRFLIDEDREAVGFVYRPSNVGNSNNPQAIPATLGVKFAQRQVILDDWWLVGGTKWSRFKFRLKHPIVYSKRGVRNLWNRIKRVFVKPKTIQPLEKHAGKCQKRVKADSK